MRCYQNKHILWCTQHACESLRCVIEYFAEMFLTNLSSFDYFISYIVIISFAHNNRKG